VQANAPTFIRSPRKRTARIGAAAGIGLHAMLATLQGYP